MAFQPKSDEHAIVEVVFGLIFARPFSPSEMDALAQEHARWKEFLPRMNRSAFMQVYVGPGAPPSSPAPASGVMFERFKPDGSLDWRIMAEGQHLYINCLSYTGWSDVWMRVREFMHSASSVAARDNDIAAALLQYVDVFDWAGDKGEYDPAELLEFDSAFIPESIRNRGHLWHLHQGWYRNNDLPAEGRMLERVSIDGLEDPSSGVPIIKIDTYLQMELASPLHAGTFLGEGPVDGVFDALHCQNKTLISSILTKETLNRIGLNAIS